MYYIFYTPSVFSSLPHFETSCSTLSTFRAYCVYVPHDYIFQSDEVTSVSGMTRVQAGSGLRLSAELGRERQ